MRWESLIMTFVPTKRKRKEKLTIRQQMEIKLELNVFRPLCFQKDL